jgi:Met-zincin/Domain of unknown function (DUF5117)
MNRELLWSSMLVLLTSATALAQTPGESAKPADIPKFAQFTAHTQKLDGYFPLYWNETSGQLWLEIPAGRWDKEFLFIDSLPAGVGSNDIGLDRAQLGETRVVKLERSGPKVLLVEVNLRFRASSTNPDERRDVEDAFARSALWGFKVAAEENGKVLVDATDFFLHDAHDVIGALDAANQGKYKLDPARSAIYLPQTKNFPRNTEVESTLTFTGEQPGEWVREVTPKPTELTVRERYSLVELPPPGFEPRAFDPRAGYFGVSYMDFSAPLGESIRRRFIVRHRLEKKDPNAALSVPVQPIVYYLDPGTPEPIRSALLEGASWWNDAFEAAGFKNAFEVKMLPPGADPMDIRYNVIEWVHRSTRGWSSGASIVDPRTGEIIKGHVTLGSLRVRQDMLIAQGLLAPYEQGEPVDPRVEQMALARLRQLAAHEVGHTLGLRHNYIASAEGRASVMDYPPPFVTLAADGSLDVSDAYGSGIGEWDKVAVRYGYVQFSARAVAAQQRGALTGVLESAMQRGLYFLSDEDARPPGSAHPLAHTWDNGTDAVEELERVLAVRQRALERFGENNIQIGQPMATLEDVLVPIYLYHRYQTAAATKVIGGLTYSYALRGDGQQPTAMVPAAQQERALDAILKTLSPETLALPEALIAAIPPRPIGYPRDRGLFDTHTGLTFDPLGAAESAANQTLGILLNPERAARLVEFHSRDAQLPGLDHVLGKLVESTWKSPREAGYHGAVQRVVEDAVLYHLMALAADDAAAAEVRAETLQTLEDLGAWAAKQRSATRDAAQRSHLNFATAEISRFEREPSQVLKPSEPKTPPPGDPIGADDWEG